MRLGSQLNHRMRTRSDETPRKRVWEIDAKDFGYAPTKVVMGDLDGSGEAPGVQLEFEHEGCPGGAAVAYSGGEAELVAKALSAAAALIKPHERLRIRQRRWERSTITAQPETKKPMETVHLTSDEQATALLAVINDLDDKDGRKKILAPIIEQLEIPF